MSSDRSEQTVITYGDEAVNKPIESVLNNSAAAYPLQSKKKKKKGGKLLVITANGYTGYGTEKKEIADIKKDTWFPQTIDFEKTASFTRSKVHYGAGSVSEFFGALEHGPRRISRIAFIGHGGEDQLALGGSHPHDIFGVSVTSSDITKYQGTINTKVKPKLTQDAKMDLYSCNSAVGESFCQDLANALGINVRGFNEQILWCVSYNEQGITSRGLIGRESKAKHIPCTKKVWNRGINKFTPPVKKTPKP